MTPASSSMIQEDFGCRCYLPLPKPFKMIEGLRSGDHLGPPLDYDTSKSIGDSWCRGKFSCLSIQHIGGLLLFESMKPHYVKTCPHLLLSQCEAVCKYDKLTVALPLQSLNAIPQFRFFYLLFSLLPPMIEQLISVIGEQAAFRQSCFHR